MPNPYAEDRFREGKCEAAIALLIALEKEKLPRERGHFFKTGRIEKLFGPGIAFAASYVACGAAGCQGAP